MQKWEYKFLYRSRGLVPGENGYISGSPWTPELPFSEIEALGEEGWELVAVKATSDLAGYISSTINEMTGADPSRDFSIAALVQGPMVAGVTTSEVFYFKRPKT
jgi:hypothetical protein